VAALLTVAACVAFGITTGVTPDDRNAKERLADGISPMTGMDLNGPTAVFKSVCRTRSSRGPSR
jgi:formate C-acetyltransferase